MAPRTAFITGATSGIGRALALHLASKGTAVGLSGRRAELLEEVAQQVRAQGGNARVYPLDVADAERTTATLRRADDEMGGLDLVVANAGCGRTRWSGKLQWEDCSETIGVNVTGAVATLIAVVPRMVERKSGHLVGISSLAGYRGLPKQAAYCASKAFLSTFLETLRIDLHSEGVKVTDVRPGFVRTPMTASHKFKMPFLVEADHAAEEIVSGIDRGASVVAFPWQLATVSRSTRLIPNGLYDRAVTRVAP